MTRRVRWLLLASGALAAGWWLARRLHPATRAQVHARASASGDLSSPGPDPSGDEPAHSGFTASYGAHPLHLVLLVVSLGLTGYVVWLLVGTPDVARIGVWFVAAIVFHDLVLFPLYALADRGLSFLARPRGGRVVLAAVNHLRLPALGSALLLLIFYPAILQQGEATYARASGLSEGADYLRSWLLLTTAFFVLSATAYVARRRLAVARPRSGDRGGQRSGLSVDRSE